MVSAILGFLSALPQLLSMIQSLMTWLNHVSGNDLQGFIVKSGQAFDQLAQAKTEADHAAAAKNISDLIRGMPSK